MLLVWGAGPSGRKVLLALMADPNEDGETVRAFFQDLRARGPGGPLLVVSNGAARIIRAIEECFPCSARQRCVPHRIPNLGIKSLGRSVAGVQSPRHCVANDRQRSGRAASAPTTTGSRRARSPVLTTILRRASHLRQPVTHPRGTRTKNRLERLFGERGDSVSKSSLTGSAKGPPLELIFGALISCHQAMERIALPSPSSVSSSRSGMNSTMCMRPQ